MAKKYLSHYTEGHRDQSYSVYVAFRKEGLDGHTRQTQTEEELGDFVTRLQAREAVSGLAQPHN